MIMKLSSILSVSVIFKMGCFGVLLYLINCKEKQLQNEKENFKKPNIILIMADDMGYSDIGSYGAEIHTPNLDELAANGVRFSQFYNAARCCPSRASLLTGLYPVETGIGWMVGNLDYPGYEGYLNKQCVTIAEVLKAGGYKTYMTGKWHLGEQEFSQPLTRGFDEFFGTLDGAGSYFEPTTLTRNTTSIPVDTTGFYYTEAISDQADSYINKHFKNTTEDPMFMYVAYTAPHWPLHAPEADIKEYEGMYAKGWDSIREQRYERQLKMGLINNSWEMTPRDNKVDSWETAENKEWRERSMEVYAAQISIMDRGIGSIMKTLEKNGQLDNTLILFLSDNGGCSNELYNTSWMDIPEVAINGKPMKANSNPGVMPGSADTYAAYGLPWANVSNTPFREYKIFTHEGGIATPFIAYYPNTIKEKNRIVHQPAHIIDVMATCLDVAGLQYPSEYNKSKISPLRGKSLMPVLKGSNAPVHKDILFWEHTGKRAARKGNWKIVSFSGKDWELYNMENDRTELHNVSAQNPDVLLELTAAYDAWAKETGVLPYEEWKEARNIKNENK